MKLDINKKKAYAWLHLEKLLILKYLVFSRKFNCGIFQFFKITFMMQVLNYLQHLKQNYKNM